MMRAFGRSTIGISFRIGRMPKKSTEWLIRRAQKRYISLNAVIRMRHGYHSWRRLMPKLTVILKQSLEALLGQYSIGRP